MAGFAGALLGTAAQPALGQPEPGLDLGAPAAAASSADGTLYLEVTINGQATQTVASFYQRNGKLLADVADLYALGFKSEGLQDLPELKRLRVDTTQGGAGKLVPLDRIPGLRYRYDAGKQTIDLSAGPQLLAPNLIGGPAAGPVAANSDTGLVLNYDAYLQGDADHGASTTLSLSNEERLFGAYGIFDSTGVAYAGGERNRYTRLDSLWHHDDPDQLTTLQAGDAISSSLSWTRSVRLGGLQYRRNFALRPDLVTFPVPTLSGSAAVPSAVDLYINDVRQFSGDVPGGPFVLNNPVALTGAGQARLVVRDELGREVSTTLPIYVDNRMVATGLSNYSLESGLLRRNYGTASFDYGGTPAASGSYRYGWSDALTFESHAEAIAGVYNGGAGGLLRLGQWGVVDAAAAASEAGAFGSQGSLGYQLILPRFSIVLNTVRNFGSYRDLASIGGTPPPRIFDQVNLSLPIRRTQSISLSFIHSRGATFAVAGTAVASADSVSVTRLASLAYTAQLARWCSLFANAYQDLDAGHSRGFWLGLSLDFGGRVMGFVNAGRTQGQDSIGASVLRNADYNGGWEWALQDNEGDDSHNRLARGGYLGRYGEFSAAAQSTASSGQGQTLLSVEGNGGLVLMDGVLEPSRHIYDSFALVATDGVAGIPVLNENRVMGDTDGSGHLLIPDLNSYQHNHLEIDTLALPADVSVPVNRLDVTPRAQSGALARFSVQRYAAATVILVDAAGQPLPSGTLLRHAESGQDFVVGYDGQAFIENLQARNHLRARGKELDCAAEFDYRPGQAGDGALPTIGPLRCINQGSKAP